MTVEKPDRDMLDRYSQKTLSDTEKERVELWLMDDPEGLEQAMLDEHLSQTLNRSMLPRRFKIGTWFHWFAYPIVLAIATVGFLTPTSLVGPSTSTEVQIVRFAAVRSGTPADRYAVSGEIPMVLELPVPLYSNGPYVVNITGVSGQSASLEIRSTRTPGTLTLLLPPEYLSVGSYTIEVSSNSGLEGEWSINVGSTTSP